MPDVPLGAPVEMVGRWRMVVRLPDPRRSYAVLIGNSTYASAELDDLPAVASNLTGLAQVLTDPALGAFPPDRCIVVPDPASAREAYRTLREYAALAEDTLLVYWAGHGGPGPRDELYLSVIDTDTGELPVSALPVGHVREAILHSPAAHRVLMLDSCLSGRAVPMGGVTEELLGQPAIGDDYILVSAPPRSISLFPPEQTYTAFTGALISLMRNGVPDGPEFLTFATIYSQLLYVLASRGLPRLQQFGTGNAGQLALTRNPAYYRQEQDGVQDGDHHPSQLTARRRQLLTAVAAAVALSISVTLADISQHQAGPTQQASIHSTSATTFDHVSLSFPVSFTVGVLPATVLNPATRSQVIGRIIGRLNQELAARHLQGRKVGLVQVFASGPITGIAGSESAARLVLDSIRRSSPIFAKAAGQGYWTGTGGFFTFQIYFLT